jgi:3-methylcrotonyl-CoA carboxylase alpha subunit
LPSAGLIHAMTFRGEEGVRIDTGFEAGDSVTPHYDSMIAKVIVHGATRAEALAALVSELDKAVVIGPKTNLAFLRALLRSPDFAAGTVDTGFIDANLGRLGAQPHPPNRKAVHAAARLLLERRDETKTSPLDPSDPWRVADSFELVGSRCTGVDVTVDGVPMRVHLVEGANVDPVETNEGGEAGDAVTLHEAKDGVYAFAGGRQAFVELVDPFAKADAGAGEGDSAIRAPMNGCLVAVAVAEGERVEAGQRLAMVEAMKMEHALIAPYAGVVRDLEATVGDQVEMGARIMWVEKSGEGEGAAKGK